VQFGCLEIGAGAGLSPMAGVTDAAMRKMCFEQDCAWAVSEMLSAKGWVYNPKNRNALDLIRRGKVKWIVNTREDGEMSAHDSLKIRSAATLAGVPVTTTLAGFAEAIKGIAAIAQTPAESPRSLQEWHAWLKK